MVLATPREQPDSNGERARPPEASVSPKRIPRPSATNRGAMEQYQRAQVETASPTRLVVLLYDGAIRFCHLARQAMAMGDFETQNTNLVRAQRIVSELLSSLNRDAGGEVAANLSRVYAYVLAELVKANLYDKPEILDHATAILGEMRASWVEIDRMASPEIGVANAADGAQPASSPLATAAGETGPARLLSKTARLLTSQRATERHAADSRLGDRLA